MIIPSIDIMNGKAVQLRQGRELVLTSDKDPVELAREFNRYGEIAVIDLDAALDRGDNIGLIRRILRVADARVGGGIRDRARADELLRAGATSIIIGTAATPELLSALPKDRVMVALDHKGGRVVDMGWTRDTSEGVTDRAKRLKEYCSSFLVTFVDDEGGMKGLNETAAKALRDEIGLPIVAAGGVADTNDVVRLSREGIDVQVGMALYTGKLDPADAVIESLNFERAPLLPTIVQDTSGRVLMLAYSSRESLKRALKEGKGVYFSRSRNEIWEKGLTSGNTQELISCRSDCDRDALLFTVKQKGEACHTGEYSCFGRKRFSLGDLYEILSERKRTMPERSFSAKLFRDRKFLLRKIMEEAYEVVSADERRNLVWEIADSLYMLSALAVDEGISWRDIEAELGGRKR